MIRDKQVSPVEVTEAMLQRIDALDSRFQSYVTVMADQAMDSARKAEIEISAGGYLGSSARRAHRSEGSLLH
ncbi:MAG: hypothetical protein VX947_04285 [Chloroflexota bacterium]|nr:hypothetical protein [Chloroflexota bacterium]